MDIRSLRYFVAIIDQGSLTRAAELVCVAQPALSQQLAGLEAECGVQLVQRGPKGVKATEAGKSLYRNARTILKQMESARAEVRLAGTDISGGVAIGLPTTAASAFGMPLIHEVRARYPHVRLQLFESMSGYIAELLNNNRLDFAILFRDTASRSVEPEPLASEALYLIGQLPASVASGRRGSRQAADSVPIKSLAGLPLVLPSGSQGLREEVERAFSRAGVALNVVADLDSLTFLRAAAREGLACTILPASSLTAADAAVPQILREIVAARIAEGGSLKPPPESIRGTQE
jgi:LysR family nitrogen assimilation transcriptional regulator